MISRIYIEKEIRDHERVQKILKRFDQAQNIVIERYGEVFNRQAQNFRLQKKNPCLILAKKHNNFVLKTPENFGIGSSQNYYFSHLLNCPYDCRYCFLQGMYSSAHYVLFVNYEDYGQAISDKIQESSGEPLYFFSGYDGDSLALDSVTGFCDYFLPFFENHPQAWLELRTKSVHLKPLLNRGPLANAVVAWSLAPQSVAEALEHQVPPLEKRIEAIKKISKLGWPIGLRFDPLIFHEDWQKSYRELIQEVFNALDLEHLHSVSFGPLRFPQPMFSKIAKLYPDEKLFAGPLEKRDNMVSYSQEIEKEMQEFCRGEILKYIDEAKLFSCVPEALSL